MKKETDYTIADLSRALIREYLSQRGLKNTLSTFQRQDPENKKKISKILLIDMLSVKHLCLINKQQNPPQNNILEVLVAYLNRKYQARKLVFAKTQPQNFSYKSTEQWKQQLKQQTVQIPNDKFIKKERPSTSKQRNKGVVQPQAKPVLKFEKDELKVIYQKVNKCQNVQDRVEETKFVEVKQEINSKESKISKINQNTNPFLKVEHLKIQEEYQQNFEEQKDFIDKNPTSMLKIQQKLVSLPPSLPVIQGILTTADKQQNIISKKQVAFEKTQSKIQVSQQQFPSMLKIQSKLESKNHEQQYNRNEAKSMKKVEIKQSTIVPIQQLPENTFKQEQKHQTTQKAINKEINDAVIEGVDAVQNKDLGHSASQQKINTLPIVLCNQPQVLQQKSNIPKQFVSQIQPQRNIKTVKKQSALQEQVNVKPTRMLMRPSKNKESNKLLKQLIQQTREVPPMIQAIKKQQNSAVVQLKEQRKIEQLQKLKEKEQDQLNGYQKGGPAQVMVTLGKKRKIKQENNQAEYPTKFKFDQNFTHQIPKQDCYVYEPYAIDKFQLDQKCSEKYPTIIFEPGINYKQKGVIGLQKKKIEKIIAAKDAQKLKTVTFQSGPSILPKSWTQGFILSPFQITPYGLKQIEGGPCGIIAAVQCYFLKHLLYCSKQSNFSDATLRQICLVAAITDILFKVKSSEKITLAFPPKGATKIDLNNLRVSLIDASTFQIGFAGLWTNREQYIGEKNLGVAALLFTVILTKGIQNIESQIDNKQNPLIGNHGHCTQEFVNLLITGKATSNCFDGDKILDEYRLKGISERAQFGFLTIFQTLKYIQVGKHLKNPIFPIWIICKQFHYHVIFAGHHLISSNNRTQKFDIIYFDGLYNCGDRIRLTLEPLSPQQQQNIKTGDLPLIEQVMMTKWGMRRVNWNGSTKIL